ncbi:MAG: LysM peptidoglycan-binding domain-containing protein [Puniceicoccales bacterium]|jgi:LysM repeat protein|nr:LysM peptidoglycan-binding domain-containing protein [Puniceicoccales bacterium]
MIRPIVFFLSAGLAILAACGPVKNVPALLPETDDPLYKQAQEDLKTGRLAHAREKFNTLLYQRSGRAPETQFEVGRLCLDPQINDPLAAIHHLRQYLLERPDTEQSAQVRELIHKGEKMFLQGIQGRLFAPVLNRYELDEKLNATLRENNLLKRDIEKFRLRIAQLEQIPARPFSTDASVNATRSAEPSPVQHSPPQPPPPAPPRRYTVQAGDTLYKISHKLYGTGVRYREIFDANRDKLPHERTPLKIGWELKIPQ